MTDFLRLDPDDGKGFVVYDCRDRPTPRVAAWEVNCPCCDRPIEYRPTEDRSTFAMDPAEWPVCEPCAVMFEPETVTLSIVPSTPSPPLTE